MTFWKANNLLLMALTSELFEISGKIWESKMSYFAITVIYTNNSYYTSPFFHFHLWKWITVHFDHFRGNCYNDYDRFL